MQNSKAKMDEFKNKFMDLLHKQTNRQMKIPAMGFSDYFVQTVSTETAEKTAQVEAKHTTEISQNKTQLERTTEDSGGGDDNDDREATDEEFNNAQKSDLEILESIEDIYYKPDSNPQMHELEKVLRAGINSKRIQMTMTQLRSQQKVLSKQVLNNILYQRNACNAQFAVMNEVQKELEESLWTCRKARSYLNYARTNLTTTSLEILAAYKKREATKDVLSILKEIKELHTIDIAVQKLLADHNYSGVISLLLKYKGSAESYMQYTCVQSLHKKLQEIMMIMELQLDTVLNEMVLNYDMRKYANLQEAYKLVNKSLIAMDQLHINFISAIHTSVNSVLRGYNDVCMDENIKFLYENLCEQVTADKYIPCLISLCKTFWTILASYYQIAMWHNNYKLYPTNQEDTPDLYVQEKLKKGQSRIWNDILSKVCIFLQSSKLITLKYDQFIQVLSIVQRLKKVGIEFCGEQSDKLIETMQMQSEEFFKRYHNSCVEEICLFLDNESWTVVDSFTNILQLPEFRVIRHTLRRHKSPPVALIVSTPSANNSPVSNHHCDELVSVHSQDGGSSIYGSYGYFLRFSEKSSPFDGGLDVAMLEEDILSGIVDEASCYFSEESDDEQKSLQSKYENYESGGPLIVNNTTLNVFRCIGRYLQMCKLLHCISPRIVACMLELLDFYAYAVHEIFGKDAMVQMESFYTKPLDKKLRDVETKIIANIKIWPLNFSSLTNNELANPDTLYGLQQRIVAVESGHSMLQQFLILQHYLNHLLPINERPLLTQYFEYASTYMTDISRPVYTCVTSRIIDLQAILNQMSKVKWDLNHVSYQHSGYIDIMNRNVQNFAMRLEETSKEVTVPALQVWNSMAHVATRLFVEGFSNVKKCSPGGRALMQLDFTNFMSIIELISNQKFPDYRNYVDAFIKTYYFSNEQFADWIESQRLLDNYTVKQLTNLIQCICVSDKRTRQKLLHFLGSSSSSSTTTTTTTSTTTHRIGNSTTNSSILNHNNNITGLSKSPSNASSGNSGT